MRRRRSAEATTAANVGTPALSTVPRQRSAPPGPRERSVPPGDEAQRRPPATQDRALYTCECGFVFSDEVTASVACPHCGATQAW